MSEFRVDISKLKIAGSEEEISKTIEELLELNKKIPSRWNEEIAEITENQFDNSKHYKSKEHRGEQTELYEKQMEEARKNTEEDLLERRFDDSKESINTHREESWNLDDEKIRGHKNIQPIWHEVYRIEDQRKNIPMEKKLNK